MTRAPVPARDAATVVLVRDAPGGIEVLLLERHAASPMSPGAFAFPGGRVEATDAAPDGERLCRGLTAAEAAATLPDVWPPQRALGFWIAALREAFEEAGLLLAYDRGGSPFVPAARARERLAAQRARWRKDPGAFAAMLAAEGSKRSERGLCPRNRSWGEGRPPAIKGGEAPLRGSTGARRGRGR
ncbi:MAG: NUDIX domain-containing protein [Candidatus Rokubacteria bacterium]|nr:NUDIX domain-containing protein [Candidatus Rokubacteria bacterium]